MSESDFSADELRRKCALELAVQYACHQNTSIDLMATTKLFFNFLKDGESSASSAQIVKFGMNESRAPRA